MILATTERASLGYTGFAEKSLSLAWVLPSFFGIADYQGQVGYQGLLLIWFQVLRKHLRGSMTDIYWRSTVFPVVC